jgi:hypothetical protein
MKSGKIVKFLIFAVVAYVVYKILKGYLDSKKEEFEAFDPSDYLYVTVPANTASGGPGLTPQPAGSTPSPSPKAFGVSTDLLPTEGPKKDDFSEFAPKNPLAEKNFLEASKMIGLDTIGGSLKNPNMSLRADPPIAKSDDVSPWLNSTFMADPLRKKLDC